jgi:hypothetical protein
MYQDTLSNPVGNDVAGTTTVLYLIATVPINTSQAAPAEERLASQITHAAEKSNADQLWDKILEVSTAGNRKTVDPLLKVKSDLKHGADKSSAGSIDVPSSGEAKSRPLLYIDGSVPTHFNIGFTLFFDKSIKELKGPLPLTIFNKNWQEDVMNFHSS